MGAPRRSSAAGSAAVSRTCMLVLEAMTWPLRRTVASVSSDCATSSSASRSSDGVANSVLYVQFCLAWPRALQSFSSAPILVCFLWRLANKTYRVLGGGDMPSLAVATLLVAPRMSWTRWSSLRSWWWLPDPLLMMST